MKRKSLSIYTLLFSLLFFIGCTVNNVTIDNEIGDIFKNKKVEGTFGIFDNSRGKFTIYNLDRFKVPYSPAETFNIFNSLVAMHTGRISDENSIIKIKDPVGISKDMSLSEAFKVSSLEHFRALAKMIGKDTMKIWVDSVKYGNMKIANAVDSFWFNNTIRISADEQLGLVKRLYFKQLPFRASVQEEVKKLMVVENNSQYQLAYQLGTATDNGKDICWVMGWIEENRHVYPFVLNYSTEQNTDTNKFSKDLTDDILAYIGFFKGKM